MECSAGKLHCPLPPPACCRYGYIYPCQNAAFAAAQEELCQLAPAAFRGAPCSDAAGGQLCFSDIAAAVRHSNISSSSNGIRDRSNGSSNGNSSGGNSSGGNGRSLTARSPAAGRQRAGTAAGAGSAGEELVCEEPRFDAGQESPYTQCRWASDPPHSRRFQVGG